MLIGCQMLHCTELVCLQSWLQLQCAQLLSIFVGQKEALVYCLEDHTDLRNPPQGLQPTQMAHLQADDQCLLDYCS